MTNTPSRARGRNGGGQRSREEESRRRPYDESETRTRGRSATQRRGYGDDVEGSGGDDDRGRGSGEWQQYAPGGSWYGRENFPGDFRDEASWTTSGPYSGKGPKGYRRSAEQITEEASQRLYRHGQVDASGIEVSCEDGVLTLKGTVADRRAKRLAEDCVESVFGVEDVVNELRVRKPSQEHNEAGPVSGRQARRSP